MNSEVDMFIRQCLQGENAEDVWTETPTGKKTSPANRSADEALEAFLDSIINKLQGHGDDHDIDQVASDTDGHVIEVLSVDTDMEGGESSG